MRLVPAVAFASTLALVLCSSRCASPQLGQGSSEGGISIVSYNVKSLFDAKDDGPEFPEFKVASGAWDRARYELRLGRVAEAVYATVGSGAGGKGPDLLCMEEIENPNVLEALRRGPLAESHYRYAAIAPAEGGPFSVCALSRLPILASSCHAAVGPSGLVGRDMLELSLDVGDGARLTVFVCHWKSKLGGAEATEAERREEAALLVGRIEALRAADPDVRIIACGDFNESPDEFVRVGRAYTTALMPAGDPASRADGAGILVASSASALGESPGANSLYSPWDSSGGFSYSYHKVQERIDGFLLAPSLLADDPPRFLSFASARAAFLFDAAGEPLAWPGTGATGYSDHLPIALYLSRN